MPLNAGWFVNDILENSLNSETIILLILIVFVVLIVPVLLLVVLVVLLVLVVLIILTILVVFVVVHIFTSEILCKDSLAHLRQTIHTVNNIERRKYAFN